MIDWLKFRVQLLHPPIPAGVVMKLSPGGVVEWQTNTGLQVEGSWSSSLTVRTLEVDQERNGTLLEVDGNPVKVLQGHNCFGCGSVRQVAAGAMMFVCSALGIEFLPGDLARVLDGDFELWRVDATSMYELESDTAAAQSLQALEQGATMRHRGRSNRRGDTLYFGQHSRRWALKIYRKGPEMRRKSAEFRGQVGDQAFDQLAAWADRCLRVEVVLRRLELVSRGLTTGSDWRSGDDERTVSEAMNGLQIGTVPGDLASLPMGLRPIVGAWRAGHPLDTMVSRATYFRKLKQADACGINLRLAPPTEERTVPHFNVAEAMPVGIPLEFRGSAMHYDFDSIRALRLVA